MIHDPESVEQKPQEIASSPVNDISRTGLLDELAVSQVMGLETDSERSKYKDEIQNLIQWAKQEGYKDFTELKWKLRELQTQLGTPPLTEKWITRASRYAYLDMETKRLKDEQMGLMR